MDAPIHTPSFLTPHVTPPIVLSNVLPQVLYVKVEASPEVENPSASSQAEVPPPLAGNSSGDVKVEVGPQVENLFVNAKAEGPPPILIIPLIIGYILLLKEKLLLKQKWFVQFL